MVKNGNYQNKIGDFFIILSDVKNYVENYAILSDVKNYVENYAILRKITEKHCCVPPL